MDTSIPHTMLAVIFRQDRGLVLEEVPVPDPGPDGVLVRVAHNGFCGTDHSRVRISPRS